MKGYEKIKYTPSRDRQWHLYTVSDGKQPIQRMFLRTLVRQPMGTNVLSSMPLVDAELRCAQAELSLTSSSIFRSLIGALEELELYSHNASVRSDHAHMYLCVLKEQHLFNLVPSSW